MVMREDEDEDNDHNYFIGRTVRKFFAGFGYFHGKVISFNRTRRFYKVKYDDGDREELDLKELKEVLVDNQPPLLLSSAERTKTSSRRGRKRRRDSTEKDAFVAGAGERQCNNTPGTNSVVQKQTTAGQLSPMLHLEDVRVLNAQTQEIYKQLRGDNDEVGKDGRHHSGDELLLEPLVPVSLTSAFERSTKQQVAGFDFEPHPGEDEGKGNPDVPVGSISPCRLKRTRVTPISVVSLETMPPVEGEFGEVNNEEVQSDDKVEEAAMTSAAGPLPPVAGSEDAGSPVWDVEGKGKCGSEVDKLEKKTQWSAFFLSLPPSSRSLGALDACISELFQVYSLLRSFSNMIFLSPFSLEELAYGLTSTDVCSLIDCVHLSLLQILRRQLERLSRNGSKSATFTLRLGDWSLLDYITWPSFLVGYMLTQGFNFDRGHSDVKTGLSTVGEYYKLPVKTKLIVLSFLCDKVLDTDEARAELGRRSILENDPDTMEMKGFAQKKQVKESSPDVVQVDHEPGTGPAAGSRPGKDDLSVVPGIVQQEIVLSASGPNSIRVGRHLDEDGNLDECVLCAMDGNLICCDGCPAAYHSRCVGVTKQGLPPGDWFCPECRADKEDPRGARISKGVRGGELLGIGPDSQLFFYTCGYLLISESGPEGQVMSRYYSPRDLNAVIRLLEEGGPSYNQVLIAAKQLCEVETRVKITPYGAVLNPSELEVSPSVISCSEHELGSHGGPDCSLAILSEGASPVEADKSLPPAFSSLITEQIKKLDLCASQLSSTVANGEPLVSSVFMPLKEEREEQRNVRVGDFSNEMNGVELTPDAVTLLTVEDEKKPDVCGDKSRKPRHDELQCESTFDCVSAELENIWKQHTSLDVPKQIIPQASNPVGDGQTVAEGRSEKSSHFIDPSSSAVASKPAPNGIVSSEGLEEGKIRLGIAQEMLKGDSTVKAVFASTAILSSEQRLSEQKDLNASLKNSAHTRNQENGSSERDVDYLSTITQMNACSYTNKYANCDLVATAAFNMAVMAGGVDDLVDDKSGTMKKSKPSSVADQLKAFTQASSHFFWPSVKKRAKDVPKEKCGWCINCRSTVRRGCLLTQVAGQMAGGAALVVGGIRPIKGGIGHFPAVAAYILYMEENLHGLLEGPWDFSGHRKKWRKQVEQANSLKNIKLALLQMESSMRRVVLSPDWDKVEQDAPESIASSALIISTVGVEKSGKKAVPKKRGRPSVVAKTPALTSYDGACFGMKWWRGGSLSRKVYNWESLSRTTLRRAGRQGGFKEIPDLVYSKSLDLPRRTRQLAWRTRLEKISSLAQVAVEVRYLDTFIKWNDIISPLEASTTHHVKVPTDIEPAFQKAEILRIKSEGGICKYLLGLPTETDEKIDTSTQQQQDALQKGVGASAEKSNNKKHQAVPKDGANELWVAENQVPLFLLKAFVEKMRSENPKEPPKSLKKGKIKVSNQRKKLSFWKMLCSPRLSGVLESKKLSGLICGYCKQTCSESQCVRCQRCNADFHKKCTQVDHTINEKEKVLVCKGCIQLRLGPRMRKPSYKMLVMHSQFSDGSAAVDSKEEMGANMGGASTGGLKPKRRKDNSVSPPDYDLFGKKRKKRLLSMPTPSQLDCESIWMEENSRKKKKKKKKGFITVFPCQYEGECTQVGKKKKKGAPPMEEINLPKAKKKPGRKKKGVALIHGQAEKRQETPLQERRKSGRIRNSISPNGAIPLSITEHQSKRKYKKRKLNEELVQPEKPMSTRRSGRKKDSPAAAQNDDGGDHVGSKPSLKRKRLKIIFAGLEVAGQNVNSNGGLEEDRKRKSGNGLDFGCRSAKSESEVHRFRHERVVLEAQVLLDETKWPVCGTCSEPYSPGQVYVSCEYCDVWYHGAAVGLSQGDADYLVGFKCHRCRKCRAPPCPAQRNPGIRARRKGAIDHGEVIDAENVNRAGLFESSSLQPSWFNSPDKEFSAFGDSKAFPDFVAATNQAEEALAAGRNNFAHVLSHDFDMSDLVLPGDSQIQLNPLSLEDQNVWSTNESAQLDLPGFSVSQADLSSQSAAQLSFTELLASEDDIFEGVSSSGLSLSAEWSGAMYGTSSLVPSKSHAAGITTDSGADNNSFVNEHGTLSGSATLAAPLSHLQADVSTNVGFGNFPSPLKDAGAGIITTNAGNDNCSSLAHANGTAKKCGNDSTMEQSIALSVRSGDGETAMNRSRSSAAGR